MSAVLGLTDTAPKRPVGGGTEGLGNRHTGRACTTAAASCDIWWVDYTRAHLVPLRHLWRRNGDGAISSNGESVEDLTIDDAGDIE